MNGCADIGQPVVEHALPSAAGIQQDGEAR